MTLDKDSSMTDTSVLAQSSTVHQSQKPLLSLPSTLLSQTITFKNLTQLLKDIDIEDEVVTNFAPILPKRSSHRLNKPLEPTTITQPNIQGYDETFHEDTDLSLAMEIPTTTMTAQVFRMKPTTKIVDTKAISVMKQQSLRFFTSYYQPIYLRMLVQPVIII